MFQENEEVRMMKSTLDAVIVEGLTRLSQLIKKDQEGGSSNIRDDNDDTLAEEKGTFEDQQY